ncbi:unnamed protein product [Ilex paraguariensis]|uniref:Uncharacterized protein n=1 Tax=Ilex paraguariensis TaxID=185542 RepID=A0ABC8TSF8_9AQUA
MSASQMILFGSFTEEETRAWLKLSEAQASSKNSRQKRVVSELVFGSFKGPLGSPQPSSITNTIINCTTLKENGLIPNLVHCPLSNGKKGPKGIVGLDSTSSHIR